MDISSSLIFTHILLLILISQVLIPFSLLAILNFRLFRTIKVLFYAFQLGMNANVSINVLILCF